MDILMYDVLFIFINYLNAKFPIIYNILIQLVAGNVTQCYLKKMLYMIGNYSIGMTFADGDLLGQVAQ